MRRSRSRLIRSLLAVTLLGSLAVASGGEVATATPTAAATRFSGADRYQTAAMTAIAAFPGGSDAVVLARGDLFPDALAGSFLAGTLDAPIVLTRPTELPSVTADAIELLGATAVHILGSEVAVSAGIASALAADGLTVTRHGGADRYATAAAASLAPGPGAVGEFGSDGKTAIIASGENFPDALAGSPLAWDQSWPVLLTRPAALPDSTIGALTALGIEHVLVLGGVVAVSANVVNTLTAGGITVDRLSGENRFLTAAAIGAMAETLPGWGSNDEIVLARSDNFPDAVAAGPLAGVTRSPILLVPPFAPPGQRAHGEYAYVSFCSDFQSTLETVFVEGSTVAISNPSADTCVLAAKNQLSMSAFVLATDPDNPGSYIAPAPWSFNSLGFNNVISQPEAGVYHVDLGGLVVVGGTVHVTTFGTAPGNCVIHSFTSTALFLVQRVTVACHDEAGALESRAFSLSFTRAAAPAPGRLGYVWANDEANAGPYSSDARYNFNSSGGTNTITRLGVGEYSVKLPGLASTGGTVKVSTNLNIPNTCQVDEWFAVGDDEIVDVLCYTTAGAPTDSRFFMTFADQTTLILPGGAASYAWANDASSPSYTPSATYSFNPPGAVVAGKDALGRFNVLFEGRGRPGGNVQVTAYGPGAGECGIEGWLPAATTEQLIVRCWNAAGMSEDRRFTVQFQDVPPPV